MLSLAVKLLVRVLCPTSECSAPDSKFLRSRPWEAVIMAQVIAIVGIWGVSQPMGVGVRSL